MALVTIPALSIWVQQEIAEDDPFAIAIINAASLVVSQTARRYPEWLEPDAVVPDRAKLIAVLLAKRTYQYPDPITNTAPIGPIGGERLIEDFVRTMHLTDEERAELEAMAPEGVIPPPGAGQLFTFDTSWYAPEAVTTDTYGIPELVHPPITENP